jgi:hypothetical protein
MLPTASAQPDTVAMLALDLAGAPVLGSVESVDTTRILVRAREARVTVSDLVAIGVGGGAWVVALVESVSRAERSSDFDVRALPVGTVVTGERDSWRFRRGAPNQPYIGAPAHLIDGELLHVLMSGLGHEVAAGDRLLLGEYAGSGASAFADGNSMFQRHLALLGSTGVGKSWAVASLLERAARLPHANIVVFDLHGEYAPLARLTDDAVSGIRRLRVAGPNDGEGEDDVLFLPYWLLRREELFALVLNEADADAPDQALRLIEHLQTLRGVGLIEAGRDDAVRTMSVDSPIPYRLGHLLQMLRRDNADKVQEPPSHQLVPGRYFGRLTSLISRFEARMGDPRYGFIFTPPEPTLRYEWLGELATTLLGTGPEVTGIKIIDLSEVPGQILATVIGVLARLLYEIQFWTAPSQRTPLCLVCDEAHLYLPDGGGPNVAVRAFESIAKEGRKYGVTLFVVSQRPSDVSRTILSQCNNFIVMRMKNDHDRAMIERLVPETLSGVTDTLPVLDVGEALVIGDAVPLPTRIILNPPRAKPASATQRFWSDWGARAGSAGAIVAGVEALRDQQRRQLFGVSP